MTPSMAVSIDWWAKHVVAPLITTYPALRRLRATLLDLGGVEVIFSPHHVLQAGKMLKRGRAFNLPVATLMGAPKACHRNTALAFANDLISTIATGFAVGPDETWLEHSWGIDLERGAIIETTMEMTQYYGVQLTPTECKRFVYFAMFGFHYAALI